jgi:hypothetical protein
MEAVMINRLCQYYRYSAALLLLCTGILVSSVAQEVAKPYYLEGNEVVFVFDIPNYDKALRSENADKVDFADLSIYDVAISGKFNDWSKKGWKMQRKNEFLFELRKHLTGFNEAFPLEFRYIINGKYIADVEGLGPDQSKYSDNFLRDVYKLDLSVLKVSASGNVVFSLKGKTEAKQVILAGSFNNWDEHAVKMERTPDGWELRAELPPGRYEYKFIVDGVWIDDPANKDRVTNEHGTRNSVLLVTRPVEFTLKSYPNASSVILAGSFNDWNERKARMTWVGDAWTITVDLPGGKHHYKLIVNSEWITDPANPLVEDDGYGNLNSVLFVY